MGRRWGEKEDGQNAAHRRRPVEHDATKIYTFPEVRIAMYLKFALVAVLALSGIAGSGQRDQVSAVVPDRAAGQVADEPVTDPGSAADQKDGVATEDLDIVVPAVGAGAAVATPPASAADAVVADHRVADRAGRVESDAVAAKGYQTLGVSWPQGTAVGDLGGKVRTKTNGKWAGWTDIEPSDNAPDAGTADARAERGGTDALWIGDADAVQLSFAASSKASPAGLSLSLIGSQAPTTPDGVTGASATGAAVVRDAAYTAGTVGTAVVGAPKIITRAEWGAPAQVCLPDVASKLVGAALHHTADSNAYTTVSQAMQQIRNDAVYHINVRGWCDIGYNFLVDKWGNIYEGRANSMTQAVIGVHAGGFNTGTVGVALLGTYDVRPSPEAQAAAARIIGWRLGAYGIDPRGSMVYYTGAGENSRFLNQNVTLPRVFGHRDVAFTECPGNGGYASLANIRSLAAQSSYTLAATLAQPVVKALYADLLGRPVDAWSLTSWSGMLASGAGQPALVAALTKSEEYVRLRVTQAYTEVLGRNPDPGGLTGWTTAVRSGNVAVDDVQRIFYGTAEYYQKSGGTPRGYVDRLFRTAFNRAPTTQDLDYWALQFQVSGRDAVVRGIWGSAEAARYRAGKYYELFLKRAPDLAGQAYWGRILQLKGEGAVRIGIAGSLEYRLLAAKRFP
ncbi:DUF4214 domain-containing protein [Pengzhenrongella sp.]|uniref:DUF4214 domain-containing protein n=1 Tax=Pengzhenrongella sp. TaxID=2888820 RepID=UPI002F9382CB